jgi:hypothetical protein
MAYVKYFESDRFIDALDIFPKDVYHIQTYFRKNLINQFRREIGSGPMDYNRIDLMTLTDDSFEWISRQPRAITESLNTAPYGVSHCPVAPRQSMQNNSFECSSTINQEQTTTGTRNELPCVECARASRAHTATNCRFKKFQHEMVSQGLVKRTGNSSIYQQCVAIWQTMTSIQKNQYHVE